MVDKAAIFSDAHERTRRQTTPNRSQRHGDRWDVTINAWVPKATYRELFAVNLLWAWRDAKVRAEEEAAEAALPPLDPALAARAAQLRTLAFYQPFSARGAEECRRLHAEARELIEMRRAA